MSFWRRVEFEKKREDANQSDQRAFQEVRMKKGVVLLVATLVPLL